MATLINGKAYEFTDIRVNLLGATVRGITAINYDSPRNKSNHHGSNKEPVSRTRGVEQPEGSITLEMKEVKDIENALGPDQKLTDIAPFPITVTYSPDGQQLVTDILEGVEFLNNPRDTSDGGGRITVQLNILPANIRYNVA